MSRIIYEEPEIKAELPSDEESTDPFSHQYSKSLLFDDIKQENDEIISDDCKQENTFQETVTQQNEIYIEIMELPRTLNISNTEGVKGPPKKKVRFKEDDFPTDTEMSKKSSIRKGTPKIRLKDVGEIKKLKSKLNTLRENDKQETNNCLLKPSNFVLPPNSVFIPSDNILQPNNVDCLEPNDSMQQRSKCIQQLNEFLQLPNECLEQSNESRQQTNECILQPNERILQPNECTLQTNERILQPNECILQPNECTLQPNERILQPNECTLQPNERTLQPNECIMQPNECTLQTNECILQPNECILQPNECTLQTNERIPQQNECILQTNECILQPNELIQQPDKSIPQLNLSTPQQTDSIISTNRRKRKRIRNISPTQQSQTTEAQITTDSTIEINSSSDEADVDSGPAAICEVLPVWNQEYQMLQTLTISNLPFVVIDNDASFSSVECVSYTDQNSDGSYSMEVSSLDISGSYEVNNDTNLLEVTETFEIISLTGMDHQSRGPEKGTEPPEQGTEISEQGTELSEQGPEPPETEQKVAVEESLLAISKRKPPSERSRSIKSKYASKLYGCGSNTCKTTSKSSKDETKLPKSASNSSKYEPKLPKSTSKSSKDEPKLPKSTSKSSKDEPKLPKSASKSFKDEPKLPKSASNSSKDEPKLPKPASKSPKAEPKLPKPASKSPKAEPKLPKSASKSYEPKLPRPASKSSKVEPKLPKSASKSSKAALKTCDFAFKLPKPPKPAFKSPNPASKSYNSAPKSPKAVFKTPKIALYSPKAKPASDLPMIITATSSPDTSVASQHCAVTKVKSPRKGVKPPAGRGVEPVVEIVLSDEDLPSNLQEDISSPRSRTHLANGENEKEGREKPAGTEEFKWLTMDTWTAKKEVFRSKTPPGPTSTYNSPYAAFRAIWDDTILSHIVSKTNLTKSTTLNNEGFKEDWYETNVDEMLILFCFWMMLGIIRMPSIKSCFCNVPILRTDIFRNLLTESRYCNLNRAFSMAEESSSTNLLDQMGPVLEQLNSKFQALYTLQQDIRIDESTTSWHLPPGSKHDIETRAGRFSIKISYLRECASKYIWSFSIAAGQKPDEVATVKNLLQPLLDSGRVLFMENLLNWPSLARYLKKNGMDVVGTVRTGLHLPPAVRRAKLSHGDIIARHSGDVMVVGLLERERRRTFISTYHDLSQNENNTEKNTNSKSKLRLIHDYDSKVGLIDPFDHPLDPYLAEKKHSNKWSKELFKRFLNLSIENACGLLGKPVNNELNSLAFRLTLVHQIVENHLMKVPRAKATPELNASSQEFPLSRLTERHFIRPISITTETNGSNTLQRNCVWCTKNGRTTATTYECPQCALPLCLENCFEEFHTTP